MFTFLTRFLRQHGTFLGNAGMVVLFPAMLALPVLGRGEPPEREAGKPIQVAAAQFQARPPALDFNGGVAWLNTDKPLSLSDLKGRVVLLDFWTLC